MVNGSFLGGAAEGVDSGRQHERALTQLEQGERGLGLRERALDIEQTRMGNAEKNELISQGDTAIAETLKIVAETVDQSLAAGRDPAVIRKAIQPLMADVSAIAERIGRDPSRFANAVEARLAAPSPVEVAEGGVRAKIAAADTVASETGVSRNAALQGQGLVPASAADGPKVQNFMLKDGSFVAVDVNSPGAREAINSLINDQGAIRVSTSVQGQNAGDLTPDPTKANTDKYILAQTSARNAISEIGRIREQVDDGAITAKLTGGLIRGLSNVAGEMRQAARALGHDDSALLDPKNYNLGGYGADAASSAGFRANATNLAYMLARAAEPGGRLSEQDVQRQINRLSAEVGDQGQFRAALDEIERSVRVGFENLHASQKQFIKGIPDIPEELRVKGDDDKSSKKGAERPRSGGSLNASERRAGEKETIDGTVYEVQEFGGVNKWVPIGGRGVKGK